MKQLLLLLIILTSTVFSKEFYLTIDDVPNHYSRNFVEYVHSKGIPATLYITSDDGNHRIERGLQEISNYLKMGFTLGNHSYSHNSKRLNTMAIEVAYLDLLKLHTLIQSNFNYELEYFRPPEGRLGNLLLNAVLKLDYTLDPWVISFNESKWPNKTDNQLVESIKNVVRVSSFNTDRPDTVLIHPSKNTFLRLALVIKTLQELGTFVDRSN